MPIHDCAKLEYTLGWLYTIAVSSTSLLFYFRVRAIYDKNLYITSFFGLLWLGILVGCIVSAEGAITTAQIGNTRHCIITSLSEVLSSALVILPFLNDTLIFFAISWRLMRISTEHPDVKTCLRTMFLGNTMSNFMKALLRDGQMYYL